MDKHDPPEPPSIPPAPPPAALLKPTVPVVPLTPMMDFLSRRLEALEKDLAVERERANAAASLLQQQEALRSQVEDQPYCVGSRQRGGRHLLQHFTAAQVE